MTKSKAQQGPTRLLCYHNKTKERRGLLACIDKSTPGGSVGGKMNIYIKVVSPSPVRARQDKVQQLQKNGYEVEKGRIW